MIEELGSVSESNALLLENTGSSRVYFQANGDYNGAIDNALTIRAWDRTQGSNGGRFNIAANGTGGTTAFSTATDTASLNYVAIADIVADSAATNEDTPVVIDVLGNDNFENPTRAITAVDGQTIVLNGTVNVTNGSVTLITEAGQQKLRFTPAPDYTGTVTFGYTVTSGGATETANVTVTIAQVQDAPRIDLDTTAAGIVADSITTNEDTPVVIDVLGNDSFENPARAITAVEGQTIVLNGTVNVTNGSVTLGVAFLVMMPVLYTDTSGAWRLRSRRQRLLIDCAGMMAELGVAAIATLLWVMLPDGALRSTAFILATTSWAMSLAINITPFMRFDGYYVLSDLSGIPNLQPRAFALGRWWLREALFGVGDEPPEDLPRRTMRWMIVYAYATWFYRLVLFVGIALLVYHLFFKLLGLLLFIVEIAVFVARPIISEIKAWYAMRDRIRRTPRFRYLAIGGGAALLLLALPTDMRVRAPAMLSAVQSQPLVAGEPALLAELFVQNGQAVKAGTPIARLVSPDIDRAIARTQVQIAELEARSDRATADAEDRANLRVLRSDLAGQRLALAGLAAQRAKLSLVAPTDGTITDIAETMTAGRWLSGTEAIARLISPRRHDVQAYVSEGDLWRLKLGATARFIPDIATEASRPAQLDEIASAATEQVEFPALASVNGGPIPVNRNDDGALKPLKAIYRVHLTVPNQTVTPDRLAQRQSGVIVIAAQPSSPLLAFFRRISRIWQAERPI